MRVIARRTLREFLQSRAGYKDQAALKTALDAWFDEVRKARWRNTAEVKRLYATASIVTGDRIVFLPTVVQDSLDTALRAYSGQTEYEIRLP
jgi:mRNA interferase HigB